VIRYILFVYFIFFLVVSSADIFTEKSHKVPLSADVDYDNDNNNNMRIRVLHIIVHHQHRVSAWHNIIAYCAKRQP